MREPSGRRPKASGFHQAPGGKDYQAGTRLGAAASAIHARRPRSGAGLELDARETSKRTGLNVVVFADESIDSLPEEHRTCIYRLVQEAVNNAVRHANARTVEVSVRKERQQVNVTVQDDGPGFDTRFMRGLGLLGMEERVRRLGGRLKISSKPGRGTLVDAALPVADLDQRNGQEANSYLAG